ncbi:MAG: hypothetical protein VW082_11760 [Candidatus Nanopelagicales bacterium]|jgi:hypothetical protein
MAPTAMPMEAGLVTSVEVAVRLAPTRSGAAATARSAAAILAAHPGVPVRLAGLDLAGSRLHLTLAIGLGEVGDMKCAGSVGQAAVTALADLMDQLASTDPALVPMPRPDAPEALAAAAVCQRREAEFDVFLADLATELVTVG